MPSYEILPSTHVVWTLDETIPPPIRRRMAERAARTTELEAGHSPFLSMRDRLADIITEAASSMAPPRR